MKIVIGFSTSPSWFSKIIRFCTRSKVSHCYVKLYDDFLQTSLILDVERTVRIIREKEFVRDNNPAEEYEIDDRKLDESIKSNLRHLGKGFNWTDWFTWLPLIKKWFKVKLQNPANSIHKMICVDFVVRVLNEADLTELPMGVLTPETLRQWVNLFYEKKNWKKIL